MTSTHELQAQTLFSTDGFVCLVTGGGTGIGLMATQALAANGARVYITGRRMEVLENAAKTHQPSEGKGSIIPIGPCDVTSKEELSKLVAQLKEREKWLDLVITNAGVSGPKAPPDSTSAARIQETLWERESTEAWNQVLDTNVTSVYFTTVAFLPLLQAALHEGPGRGHLSPSAIVISSMSGIMRDAQGHFSYNAAKGATVHLARLMSAEFEKTGVRVNSIAPGYFPSEMTTGGSDESNKSGLSDEAVQSKGHEVPAGRAGADGEMAMAVLMLARNRYVNGEVIAIDGGVLNNVPGR